MKNIILKFTLFAFIMFLPLFSIHLIAQPQPPFHGQNGNQPDGAPLDGGISILVLMAAAYGGGKIHLNRKKEKKD